MLFDRPSATEDWLRDRWNPDPESLFPAGTVGAVDYELEHDALVSQLAYAVVAANVYRLASHRSLASTKRRSPFAIYSPVKRAEPL